MLIQFIQLIMLVQHSSSIYTGRHPTAREEPPMANRLGQWRTGWGSKGPASIHVHVRVGDGWRLWHRTHEARKACLILHEICIWDFPDETELGICMDGLCAKDWDSCAGDQATQKGVKSDGVSSALARCLFAANCEAMKRRRSVLKGLV